MAFLVLLIVALIFGSTVTTEEVKNFRMCRNAKCSVFNVFIEPCPEALDNKPCEVPQGINASISFQYISNFTTEIPITRLYASTLLVDLPFMDMDTNACLYTQCPMVAQVERSWLYNLYVSENYPKSSYTVKLKFWDGEPEAKSDDECCFKFDMKIV